MRSRTGILLLVTLLVGAGGNLAAHVTVEPKEVPVKSFQEFRVRVPTEKDQPTTAVRLVFPNGFEVRRIRPTAGWKYELEKDASGRISAVTWSGGSIGRTEYEVFSFMAGSQSEGTLTIQAYQTYGEHDVVAWVDASGARPAPRIQVLPAAASSEAAADHLSRSAVTGTAAGPLVKSALFATTGSFWFSGVASLIALIALFISWRTSRRSKL
jgi:uncharacterized protein YcnI